MTALPIRTPVGKRAVVVGAGSFGTAIAVLLARSGMRTTLQTRSSEQAERLIEARENREYLPGVELARELRIEPVSSGLSRAEYVFLGVPCRGLNDVISALDQAELPRDAAIVSLAKGLVPPSGESPSALLTARVGSSRVAVIGGPAHAREMVTDGAGLVAASVSQRLSGNVANLFTRGGVVCEQSLDPVGVELAGIAKNAAALAAGATVPLGLNAAGAAAAHIFLEVWRYAEKLGARPESMIGLAGTGDLVATALAPMSRNRRAGELLAKGVPTADIPAEVGQAVEALDLIPLLTHALTRAGTEAPVLTALNQLIAGEIPLDAWVGEVRATVPRPRRSPRGLWARLRGRR